MPVSIRMAIHDPLQPKPRVQLRLLLKDIILDPTFASESAPGTAETLRRIGENHSFPMKKSACKNHSRGIGAATTE
jgi:hypothetical protein